jgi:DNA invertase Pin-like site-specific DNA recombinase
LARNVHLVSGLMESGVDFIACDNPNANKLTVHILAAVAEDEAERISQRTTAALEAAKARGVLLGSSRPNHWKGREDRRQAGAVSGAKAAKIKRDADALPVYAAAAPIAKRLSDEGASLQEIADELNGEGLTTVRGMPWNRMQVSRLLGSVFCASVLAGVVVAVG